MHEVREFAEDREVAGQAERKYRPWCLCGWIGEWTDYGYLRTELDRLHAQSNRQFMEHLEGLRLKEPMNEWVFGDGT